MRFLVLATSMNMAVFWDIVLCNLLETDWRFRGAASIIRVMITDDGDSKPLWSFGKFLQDQKAQQSRRQ
jgi:hypothetical protein